MRAGSTASVRTRLRHIIDQQADVPGATAQLGLAAVITPVVAGMGDGGDNETRRRQRLRHISMALCPPLRCELMIRGRGLAKAVASGSQTAASTSPPVGSVKQKVWSAY